MIRAICCLCGRKTQPAVLIGGMAVGPTCARNAGLMEAAAKNRGALTLADGFRPNKAHADQLALDLTPTAEEAMPA